MRHKLYGQSIIWSQDFDKDLLDELFVRADHYKKHPRNHCLRNKRVIMFFYEPSTRTRFSFEAAVKDLGGSCQSTDHAGEFSSVAKGESLEDSIRTVSAYGDAIVLRHFEDDAAMRARDFLQSLDIWKPIFNAGCGKGQHPTQSVLDLYTIRLLLGRLENLTIVIVGDHKHSRVVRSLVYLLGKYSGIRIRLVSPLELFIGYDMLAYMRRHNVEFTETTRLEDVIESADIVYMVRAQKERFEDPAAYERLKHSYRLTSDLALRMRPHARIMHPLPKVDEIDENIYRLPLAKWFEQSDNGVPIRKALLEMVLGE